MAANRSGNTRFAVVIPVFNHGRTVRSVVAEALKLEASVIVVDDGSSDNGCMSLASMPGVQLIHHTANRGKGAALLTGFRAAAGSADWAVTMDADGQHHPADAHALIRAIPCGLRPIVIGYRRQMAKAGAPWTSRFGRGFSNFWIRMAGGPRVSDSQSGFRVYPLPETIELGVRARRYQFEVEVLVKAGWSGMPVVEAPVRVVYQSERERISHFRPVVDFMLNSCMFARLICQHLFAFKRLTGR
jgi:glycosyltransferase involved in cell wall biosynthesis